MCEFLDEIDKIKIEYGSLPEAEYFNPSDMVINEPPSFFIASLQHNIENRKRNLVVSEHEIEIFTFAIYEEKK